MQRTLPKPPRQASSASAVLAADVNSVTLSGSLDSGLGMNCHGFNPTLGLTTGLNQAVNNMGALPANAATSAISALPGLVLLASVGIFALRFLTALWALSAWLDTAMTEALGIDWASANSANGVASTVAEMTGYLTFVGLALVWFLALSWAGHHLAADGADRREGSVNGQKMTATGQVRRHSG